MTATQDRRLSCPSASKSIGRPLSDRTLAIRDEVIRLTDRYERMTVRQVFYQLESTGVVEKTEGGYRQVQTQVLRMRWAEDLPWEFIADGTRLQRRPASYADAGEYVNRLSRTYRRDLWQRQNVRLEFWLEKDALSDIASQVTYRWDVALMVSRGQSSATFIYNAAKEAERAWERAGVETYIYTLYDFDAGGIRASNTIEQQLPIHAPETPIHFQRLAVTEDQIYDWNLPTRPAKKSDPGHAMFVKDYGSEAVELDAIDPEDFKELIEDAITSHVDDHEWEVEKAVEAEERKGLLQLASRWRTEAGDG